MGAYFQILFLRKIFGTKVSGIWGGHKDPEDKRSFNLGGKAWENRGIFSKDGGLFSNFDSRKNFRRIGVHRGFNTGAYFQILILENFSGEYPDTLGSTANEGILPQICYTKQYHLYLIISCLQYNSLDMP